MSVSNVSLTVACLCLIATATRGEETKKSADAKKSIEGLIIAAPLPSGYKTQRQDLTRDGKVVGSRIVVQKEGSFAKVLMNVENRDLPTKGHKMAALKGYVNGTVNVLTNAGFKLTKMDMPDASKINVSKRTTCKFTFTDPQNNEVYLEIQVFFAKAGYSAAVISKSRDDYRVLSEWASSVEAKQ